MRFAVPTSRTLFIFILFVAPHIDHTIDHIICLFIFAIIPFLYIVSDGHGFAGTGHAGTGVGDQMVTCDIPIPVWRVTGM